MEQNKEAVNKAFKKVFGAQGPNSKGLILLSQHCQGTVPWMSDIFVGCCCHCCQHCYHHVRHQIRDSYNSSCLYVGDADLKNSTNISDVKSFLNAIMTDKELELMQIPHHGSSRNSSPTLDQEIPADIYFVNDRSTNRLQKNARLFSSLMSCGKLHVSRGNLTDLIVTCSRI